MTIGKITARMFTTLWAATLLALAPQAALAQAPAAGVEVAPPDATAAEATSPQNLEAVANEADGSTQEAAPGADGYTPLGPEWIKGQPTPGGLDVQPQYSPTGEQAMGFHTALVWIMALISAFVLGLLLYVMVRFRRGAHPTPTRTTHNTTIEVVWTLVPVLILIGIAIPSISLLSAQYKTAPKDAVTVKVTGYQWYWGYTYPDNGGFEVISNMLPDEEAIKRGEPPQLAADNRMVVPAGEWLRIQTTAADVIHAFAVPSLWFKLDAVPGRLNEKRMFIKEPGIYYGQCSELCGAKHGYMPIAVEALPRPQWEAWVRSQGGTVGEEAEETPAAPESAPLQQPESGAQAPEGAPADAPTPAPTP